MSRAARVATAYRVRDKPHMPHRALLSGIPSVRRTGPRSGVISVPTTVALGHSSHTATVVVHIVYRAPCSIHHVASHVSCCAHYGVRRPQQPRQLGTRRAIDPKVNLKAQDASDFRLQTADYKLQSTTVYFVFSSPCTGGLGHGGPAL